MPSIIVSTDYTFFQALQYTASYATPLSPHTPIVAAFLPPPSLSTVHTSPAFSLPVFPFQTSNSTSFLKTFYTTRTLITLTNSVLMGKVIRSLLVDIGTIADSVPHCRIGWQGYCWAERLSTIVRREGALTP